MARILVIGTLAWDRFIQLDAALESGARITGLATNDGLSSSIGGQLGGGAANASSCLKQVGHEIIIYCCVSNSEEGDAIINASNKIGFDTSWICRINERKNTTLILIEPSGERTIIGVGSDLNMLSNYKAAIKQMTPPSSDAIKTYRAEGIFLRSAFPGWRDCLDNSDAFTISHLPLHQANTPIAADIAIGSKNDLLNDNVTDSSIWSDLSSGFTDRLKHVILTDGANGGTLYTANSCHNFKTDPAPQQIDTTGAGDCFAAGVLDACLADADIEDAISHGASWGRQRVSVFGGATPIPSLTKFI